MLLVASLLVLAARAGSTAEDGEGPRVVCYHTSWAAYRPGAASFTPQNINPYLCTHLTYAYGSFTNENTLAHFDKFQDIDKGGFANFTGLKAYNPKLKTMFAIGGGNEGSSRFSALAASAQRRREFVLNSIKFLREHNFDGLELVWHYPTFRDGGRPMDRANHARLVQELRQGFENESNTTGRPRLLMTMAMPSKIDIIDKAYDIPKLNKYLDWMNVLCYDYHTTSEPAVDHISPLYALEAASEYNQNRTLNTDFTIKHLIKAGVQRDKLVLCLATYGWTFTLFDPESTDIGARAVGPGELGESTRDIKGSLAYFEICERLMQKNRVKSGNDDSIESKGEWTVVRPEPKAMGPYAYKGNQWIGYDDIDSVKTKAEYVAMLGLGGIAFWTVDKDDFRGKCHGKPYPLIEAAKETLYNGLGTRKTPAAVAITTDGRFDASEPQATVFKCEKPGIFPHPRDCKKHFRCLDSGSSDVGIFAHEIVCPTGWYFDKSASTCVYSPGAVCGPEKAATTKSASSRPPSGLAAQPTTRPPFPRITTTPMSIEEAQNNADEDKIGKSYNGGVKQSSNTGQVTEATTSANPVTKRPQQEVTRRETPAIAESPLEDVIKTKTSSRKIFTETTSTSAPSPQTSMTLPPKHAVVSPFSGTTPSDGVDKFIYNQNDTSEVYDIDVKFSLHFNIKNNKN